MRLQSLPAILLALAALFAGCGDNATGTFVRLSFSGDLGQVVPIDRIEVDLQLGGKPDSTVFQAPDQNGIKLPTDAVLDIGSGEGLLLVTARALSKDAVVLGIGSGSGTVVRGQTASVPIALGPNVVVDAGVDSGIDEPSLLEDAGQATEAAAPLDGPAPTDSAVEDAPVADAPVPLPDGPGNDSPAGMGGITGAGGITMGKGGAPGTGGITGAGGIAIGKGGAPGAGGITGGTGGSPGTFRLTVNPQSLDFGIVQPNTPSPPKTLTVSNNGDAPSPSLVLWISDTKNFVLKPDARPCSNAVLNPGEVCTATFVFTPSVSGSVRADGSLTPATGMGVRFQLSGTGAGGPATLSLSPATASVGPVDVGASASVSFTLSNGGDTSAGTITTQLDGPATFQLTNNTCAGLSLDARGQCSFAVTFAPTAFGPASAKVNVQSSIGLAAGAAVSAVAQDYVQLTIDFAGKGVGVVTGGPQSCRSGNPCTFKIARTDPSRLPRFVLEAQPTAPSVFGGWSGLCNGPGTCPVTMDGPHSVTAIFDVPMATLNVTVLGLAGHTGALVSDDGSVNCSGSCPGLSVPVSDTFILRPKPDSGSTFAGWTSGPCSGAAPKCSFQMGGTISVTATFGPQSYMFVSSTTVVPGALGGLAGADAQCTTLAQKAGLPGKYVAWLSTSTTNANQRVGAGGWIRTDGRPFAHDLKSLTDASYLAVLYPPRLDEQGKDVASQRTFVATGSGVDGSAEGTQCGDYTTTSGNLNLGDAASGSSYWSYRSVAVSGCASPQHLYCFRSDLAPGVLDPAPQAGRRVFATTRPFVLSDGIPPNDACSKDAEAAGISDPKAFVAFLATTKAAAISLVDLGGRPWKRMDGVFIVEQAADLEGGKLLAPVDATATGRNYTTALVWAGAKSPNSVGTSTCDDWAVPSPLGPSITGLTGISASSSSPDWFGGGSTPCTFGGVRLICIEP